MFKMRCLFFQNNTVLIQNISNVKFNVIISLTLLLENCTHCLKDVKRAFAPPTCSLFIPDGVRKVVC